MPKYTVTIGADLRCYHETEVKADSPEAAKTAAIMEMQDEGDLAATNWNWSPECVQGEISLSVDDGDFVDVPSWHGPGFNDLIALVRELAKASTTADEFEAARKASSDGIAWINGVGCEDLDGYRSEIGDERLGAALAEFETMIQRARDLVADR
ncbi:hypothetical protein [Amorphus orientalis]|uniref:Uncharacterized protein n=1 Tax=Amorphus orientalis TaxID=649198 RepID=A0AAE3VS50_9HYPH|nr:hypothetical protein [Amorphus orientalis]MDQ0317769.1 hypothetical protein [Amorphus orientalis]